LREEQGQNKKQVPSRCCGITNENSGEETLAASAMLEFVGFFAQSARSEWRQKQKQVPPLRIVKSRSAPVGMTLSILLNEKECG
jgi:hypothetical protein